ncbi:hypothetical protein SAMN05216489_04959 [Streptomyces sp. 3213]|uniref:hypothetical protein n=1 Tax=Streptomyces sp. 3213.3 TaxID=1855348 RepID=UPI000899D53B|nr:hypothetical protein [Streptomyces sp. 3213.3]SED93301.1 hypothetical protein SAMN05216489_04959 [Streptomyces sp. 3213] [Streptomyces sp. 3213.3]
MSTRTTFEDRLLAELKREILLRETAVSGSGVAEGGVEATEERTSVRRLLTPRRIAVVLAACAAAWLAAVTVPGVPAGSKAYAVERHDDGTVTFTVKDQAIDAAAQRELARKVRPWGIEVIVDVLSPGYVCARSHVTLLVGSDRQGHRVPLISVQGTWQGTLRRGNVLAFENTRGSSRPRAVEFYATRSEAEPCVPVKIALPDDS